MARKTRAIPMDAEPEGEELAAPVEEMEEWHDGIKLPKPKGKGGRPVYKYNPQYAVVAAALMKKGATSFDLAEAFGISDRTVRKCRVKYPEFDEAFKTLGPEFDSAIERRLAERAMGFYYTATKPMMFKGVVTLVEYPEYMPADVGAIKHWLAARKPDTWRIKDELEVSGDEAFKELLIRMGQKKADNG